MIAVAKCESGGVHFKPDGSVIKGRVNNLDRGVMQVNLHYWQAEAEKLGLDIHHPADNVKMARHIYDTQGITAWHCHNLGLAYAA